MGTGWFIGSAVIIAIFVVSLLLPGCTAPSPPLVNTSGYSLVLTSDAFQANGSIPVRYTCDGQEESPPLSWGKIPVDTRSFALIMEDPDAPAGTYTHWILYNIPGERRELPAGIASGKELPDGEIQGTNSNRKTGYTGPCPSPRGSTHRYVFTLFALDTRLDLTSTVDARTLRNAMEGHVLGTGQLTCTYMRS
jgi:Raf kinase inhibitor-like YbhB/YbcL family protein